MAVHRKVYRFRMRPTKAHEQALARLAGARRWVWNWALDRRKAYFAEHGTTIPAATLSAELTALKREPETAWLAEADSQALQQTLRDLDRAFRNFFEKRARFPRFKSKRRDPLRFRIPQRVKVDGEHVVIPKVGRVRIRQVDGRGLADQGGDVPPRSPRPLVRHADGRIRDARCGVAAAPTRPVSWGSTWD